MVFVRDDFTINQYLLKTLVEVLVIKTKTCSQQAGVTGAFIAATATFGFCCFMLAGFWHRNACFGAEPRYYRVDGGRLRIGSDIEALAVLDAHNMV